MTMTEHDQPLVGSWRRSTEEFKADATALVLDDERSISRVVRDLRIGRYGPGEPGLRVSGCHVWCLTIPPRSGEAHLADPRQLGHLSNRSANLQNDPHRPTLNSGSYWLRISGVMSGVRAPAER